MSARVSIPEIEAGHRVSHQVAGSSIWVGSSSGSLLRNHDRGFDHHLSIVLQEPVKLFNLVDLYISSPFALLLSTLVLLCAADIGQLINHLFHNCQLLRHTQPVDWTSVTHSYMARQLGHRCKKPFYVFFIYGKNRLGTIDNCFFIENAF